MKSMTMNLEVLMRNDLTNSEKLIYHMILSGLNFVQDLMEAGQKRAYLYQCLNELIRAGLVKCVRRGYYEAVPPEQTQSPPEQAQIPPEPSCCPTCRNYCPAGQTNPSGIKNECPPGQTSIPPEQTSFPPQQRFGETSLNKSLKKDKQEKKEFQISLKMLFDGIDFEGNQRHRECRSNIRKFLSEKNLSPDLVDRIAAAYLKDVPGFEGPTIHEVWGEASADKKVGRIKKCWYRIAAYTRKIFEMNGIEWTECRPPRDVRTAEKIAGGQKPVVEFKQPEPGTVRIDVSQANNQTPIARVPVERVTLAELQRRQAEEEKFKPLIDPESSPSKREAQAEIWHTDFMEQARRIEAGTEEINYSGQYDYAKLREDMIRYEEIEDAYKMPRENADAPKTVVTPKPHKPKSETVKRIGKIIEEKRAELDDFQKLARKMKIEEEKNEKYRNENNEWEWE